MFTNGQGITLAAIAIGLMLILVGCGSTPPTPFPTPGLATIPFPTGVFERPGSVIEYRADGTFLYQGEEGGRENGTYTVTGDQFVYEGDYCGKGVKGIYTWAYDGKVLSIKGIFDTCNDRWMIAPGSWTKRP